MTAGYEPGRLPAAVLQSLGATGPLVALASNENALGPSPRALQALLSPAAHVYPDAGSDGLRQRLAAVHDVAPGRIAVGPGTTDLLYHLVRTCGGGVMAPPHTFVAYRLAARAAGLPYCEVPFEALAGAVDRHTRLVCIANPGNPTGELHGRDALLELLDRMPSWVTVVVDEAYHEYLDPALAPDGVALARIHPGLVVLRTFSKAYGLAGLRVGWMLGAEAQIARLDANRPPFPVSGVAEAAALAALDDPDHVRASRLRVAEGRRELQQGLAALGFPIPDGHGNFVCVHVGPRARAVWEALVRCGVLVRKLDPYGLSEHLRVSIGTTEQNRRFLEALAISR